MRVLTKFDLLSKIRRLFRETLLSSRRYKLIPIAVERINFDGSVSGALLREAMKSAAHKNFIELPFSRSRVDLIIVGYNSVYPRDDAVLCLNEDGTDLLIDPRRSYKKVFVSSTEWYRDDKRRGGHSHNDVIRSIRDFASKTSADLDLFRRMAS